MIDSKENIWISLGATTQKINLKDNTLKKYSHDEKNTRSIGRFRVFPIMETQNGKLFLGTSGSGLFGYNSEADDFETYSVEDGLASDFCYHISESSSGNLILLNNNGLSIFDPKVANKVIFKSSYNFPLRAFSQGSSCYITKDNEIFIGGANGMVSVFESSLKNALPSEYNLYFDKLYINNRHIIPNDETGILSKTLWSKDSIHLKHNQNNISIEFATSNYLHNTTQYYQYKLEGFDEEWFPSTSNLIVYTNINSGKYTFWVREMNYDRSIGKTNQLAIYIAPPFYKTKLAYAFYIIICLVALAALIRFFIWRSSLHTALLLERQEKEQIEKLNQTKLRFFTNISHELRTPLTLIMGNTEIALQAKDMNTQLHKRITQIHKNTVHMRNLISELLDFRKQEQGFYKLKVEKTDLINYIYDIYESFSEYAIKSSINYVFEKTNDELFAYIDPPQFKKAVYNLLSNAFKYTSPDGEITIRLKQNESTINIQIEDDGIGIPADAISKIFERFYQVEYRSSGFSLGTGIGLALTKEIVNSHGGEIGVRSAVSKGSIFEIILPVGKSHFNQDQLAENDTEQRKRLEEKITVYDKIDELDEPDKDKELSSCEKETTKHTVLIIEDNEELLDLLCESFAPFYNVYTATNGKIGLRMTLELQPDLVISDIMMPEMSGKEMCNKIKNNLDILHIPVLLLTSQATTEETIEGFMYGADAYVTKPFNIELLISQCNNLIKNRLLLYQSITRQENNITSFNLLSDSDQNLIDKATEIIRKNMSNPDFDMNQLASELGMSRSKLYTKIKDITKLTPNEFTLNLKLREALNMLENLLDLNVSDIAVTLGFSTTKYFSKCFRTFYNISPLQWRKNKQDEAKKLS